MQLQLVYVWFVQNDLATLKTLTAKWRTVVQQSLTELSALTPDPKPPLTELIDYFQLDHGVIGYKADEEAFI